MKRSEINQIIRQSMEWIREMNVHLPPFAYWTVQDWLSRGSEYDEIRANMLGWDVTDFGKGDFSKTGLVLFTIRNGNLKQPRFHKPYAEKMLLCDVNQVTPFHYHWSKMEDIINRGGGILAIQLWNADDANGLAQSAVDIRIDGRALTLPAGSIVRLSPGESITLSQGQYHQFWAEASRVLAWEVSMVNDDNSDNCFYEPLGRFSSIEEDEPQQYLLCNEYRPAQ